MKKILPLLLGAALMGGGYFAYTTFFAAASAPESPVEAQAKANKELAADRKQRRRDKLEGPVVALGDPFVVNLADASGAAFAKVNVVLRVDPAHR